MIVTIHRGGLLDWSSQTDRIKSQKLLTRSKLAPLPVRYIERAGSAGLRWSVGFDYLHDVPRQLKLTKHFMLGAAKVWQRTS
jgi:hypothetical protein